MHLITFAGWEDRFSVGVCKVLRERKISRLTIFYSAEYQTRTAANRLDVFTCARDIGVECEEVCVDFSNQKNCWLGVKDFFECSRIPAGDVLVDITTMPREVTWYVLFFLVERGCRCEYVYHKPISYGSWLTEDAGVPRFALKLSGIADMSKRTMLIIVTGYDSTRTAQICNYFEPDKVCFAIQKGSQFENIDRNRNLHSALMAEFSAFSVEVDCYGKDCGRRVIERVVKDNISQYNIVLASLGPKLSSIALFNIVKKYAQVALCYAPSAQINEDYSSGCGASYFGSV